MFSIVVLAWAHAQFLVWCDVCHCVQPGCTVQTNVAPPAAPYHVYLWSTTAEAHVYCFLQVSCCVAVLQILSII